MSTKRLTREIIRNNEELYKEQFRTRGVKFIDHYSTAKLNHPEMEDMLDISTLNHVWSVGDRYSKLADKYYGDPRVWWVIAWFNQLPTEAHVSIGRTIRIPLPLENIMMVLKG